MNLYNLNKFDPYIKNLKAKQNRTKSRFINLLSIKALNHRFFLHEYIYKKKSTLNLKVNFIH